MLEDQVAFLLQKYLGNYVQGLNKEALKISVWRGDVELTNMQLKPEALNALKLPVKVKAGFLGSVKLKVPWSKLGQEPVLVYLDRIFLLAEPATQIEGCSEDAIQEAKKIRLRELEMKLLEQQQQLKSEMNTSWLGSLISTIIGNLKLSITNIHVRYEDQESNPGNPFAAGLMLSRLSAVTVDNSGKETFATGGALERIQKSVELDRLAFYFDSDISPWHIEKSWTDLLPSEWNQVFELGDSNGQSFNTSPREHVYILQPVTGNAKYTKLRLDESRNTGQALQQAVINLDDVTVCLSKDGYRDILKLADNFAAFNQRLKYAHYRPQVPVKSDPRAWWRYACQVIKDETKKASGKLSWEQVLRHARIRKRYLSLYASLLKSDLTRLVIDDNKEIDKLDRELDIGVILQWRMLAHKFVEQSVESDIYQSRKKVKQSWWSFGWTASGKDDNRPKDFNEEDWERLNKIIGYKDGSDENLRTSQEKDLPHLYLEIHMKHNASKLIADGQECLADLSCEGLTCSLKTYSESKVFDFKLESYSLLSPNGLLAESAYISDSLVGVFTYKPFDAEVDWSFVAKASPCYMTYLKDSIEQIISFFKSNTAITHTLALETAAAVQMTIDGVRRTAQQQVTQALKDRSRFFIDLDISAPKITIPTDYYPDDRNATKLLLDLGNLMLCTQDYWNGDSSEENDIYLQFSLILSDVSAFLVDGDFHWRKAHIETSASEAKFCTFFPVIEKCGIALKLQQILSENPFYPSMRLAVRVPSLGFYFSPARYHRLLQVAKVFQGEGSSPDSTQPWSQADFEGWLSILTWKGVGNREAIWQRRYLCLVGPFLYMLENPKSKSYKQYISLRGKQVHHVPKELTGNAQNVLAVYDAGQSNLKVEDASSLVLLCDSNESQKIWQNRIQGAIYRALGSAATAGISDLSSLSDVTTTKSTDSKILSDVWNMEKLFVTGVLDELRVCFSCCYESNPSFRKVLLGNEKKLFEFRALGGQVELSIREDTIYVGILLKSLEILDQYQVAGEALPRYLARSLLKNTNEAILDRNQSGQAKNEDKFFEASDELDDVVEYPPQRSVSTSEYFTAQASSPSAISSMKPPCFSRVPGLIPNSDITNRSSHMETSETMDSFVKAQLIIYSQDSPNYDGFDNRVVITLATLAFFCHRPTILAILGFVNSINVEAAENPDSTARGSKSSEVIDSTSKLDDLDEPGNVIQEPVAKGFLNKGKTRIIFYLSLNMATAQIYLMNEDGISIVTLSQTNLLADIKVFSSSFSIKAALGNLKISDDTLPRNHSYFWVCDMRNPGGRSFVELDFSSYSEGDEDYSGYDYSLTGQLSEVRIVYLNRFVQEVLNYFMGLVPSNSESFVKLKDYATNSEKRVSTSEIEGSPSLKLDLSLSRPIILMPRRTDSADYIKLDALHITVQNEFQWLGGDKNEISAVHLDIMTIKVEDINLTVGTGTTCGESIIQDVNGLSVVIQRALRDLLHQIPETEATIQIEVLKASLSNKEYEIITDCASSNISETPHRVPKLEKATGTSEKIVENHSIDPTVTVSEPLERAVWITMKVSVSVNFVELSLHSGITRDSPLASIQSKGAWLLYKSNSCNEGFLFATLKGFSVIDAREGIKEEFRLAIGKSWSPESTLFNVNSDDVPKSIYSGEEIIHDDVGHQPIPSMLILDATFRDSSTNISLCVQRPKLLVALDFLLVIAEFFVPSLRTTLSDEERNSHLPLVRAIILDQQIYVQPSSVFSLSPQQPLIVDDEKFEHFIYDGKGGKLLLQNRNGRNATDVNPEIMIHVGNGKRLQFKNVTILNGQYLDSCVLLGSNSSYSASAVDNVFLEGEEEVFPFDSPEDKREDIEEPAVVADGSTEFIIELQAIGPELTFYNSSEEVGRSLAPSKKAIHAYLDAFCRIVMKGDSLELNGNVIGLKMESNGIRILEPFDTSVKFSNTSGKTNIHLSVSDIFMNFSFTILRLFLAVEEDIMAFLRMTSKKVSVVCSQFDKVGTIQSNQSDQIYAFWRPRAPSGFAVLGDCLTPLNEPPSKGVLAVNTSFAKVKRPVSYRLILSVSSVNTISHSHGLLSSVPNKDDASASDSCSIWLPVAPKGYVAVGCVVSSGSERPSLSSALCILSSLVSPCSLKDCIAFQIADSYATDMAFWRVENSFGSFLPSKPSDMRVDGRAYELRHMIFQHSEQPMKTLKSSTVQKNRQTSAHAPLEEMSVLTSGWLFGVVARFKLVWWNRGRNPQKKLSIWRPVVPHGMFFLGDLAVQGYEPPNSAIILNGTGEEALLKCPQDFLPVGHIRKCKGDDSIYFWLPVAPPGFVVLGCVASKGSPKGDDFNSLRCVRSDMVTGDQFSEENIWDTTDTMASTESFSLWSIGSAVGTFVVRKGFKKPPKRFALKLAVPNLSSRSDDTVIDAEMKAFSVAVFDDYGGLMVPLFNVSLSSIGFNLHGRPDYMNSTVSFSLAARSYNDKYDSWEPLIEPTDGFLRYQYDQNTPGAATQVRMTSTKDLNLNLSVSNANMIFQAYASWNNLSSVDESYVKTEVSPSIYKEGALIDINRQRNYFIIPENKLGQDIYIRAAESKRLSSIIKMPSGGNRPVKVPVPKNMMNSHLKERMNRVSQSMLTVIISEAEFPAKEGLSSAQYTVAVRLFLSHLAESPMQQQSARTCGAIPEPLTAEKSIVKWSEILFFKVDFLGDYVMEFVVIDMGRGEPVGIYSAPLKQIAYEVRPDFSLYNSCYDLTWRELSSAKKMDCHDDVHGKVHGRINCAVLLSVPDEVKKDENDQNYGRRAGFIQISPTREGPWTTVRLNYASPAACWRLGNEVVASEVIVKDGNRYVNIRSLVSVTNNTDFIIDLRLKSKFSPENLKYISDGSEGGNEGIDNRRIHLDEFFETEKYSPSDGWISCSLWAASSNPSAEGFIKDGRQETPSTYLPDGWEWVDEWHVDITSVEASDGWVYAPDTEHLKWPESLDHINSINYARQRRWIRHRMYSLHDTNNEISIGLLEPGHTIPLPLSYLVHPVIYYVLQLRPKVVNEQKEYSWSSVLEKRGLSENLDSEDSEICISALIEADELLNCSEVTGVSTDKGLGLWFCLKVQATQIGKDIHSDPIHDWKLTISSPLSITNFLPLTAEYAITGKGGESPTCSQGTLIPGKSVKIYNADLRNPLYLSILPQGGWDLIHEPSPLSHPNKISSKMMSLRNSHSGRIVMVILEQNFDKDCLISRNIRIYVPYWIASARCPPLIYNFIDKSSKRHKWHYSIPSISNTKTEKVLWQITDEEMSSGYTIASSLNFKFLGISVSLEKPGKEHFGPVRDLSPLGHMDGSVDLYAYDTDGMCMRIFISSKPSPYEAVPTKVILVRPFMSFTNRLGQDLLIKFNTEDQPKVLRASDTRVSFVYCDAGGPEKIQVRLQSTSWCLPLEIVNEDTFTIALRNHHGGRTYLRAEVRGYEEGSRLLVVFRMESENGPIRIENRMGDRKVNIRQCGLDDDTWIQLEPLSTSNFSWDDPYGQRLIDVSIQDGVYVKSISLEEASDSTDLKAHGVKLHVEEVGDIKVVRFLDGKRILQLGPNKKTAPLDKIDSSSIKKETQASASPLELIVELGIVGIALIDHRPRELLYLYLEKVFVSYSTGYDAGKINRFKLIVGKLQLDNQLPLTVMPVLFAPEDLPDINHPVFKATITSSNDNTDGTQVYPYVYVRVTDKCWRINMHEPIIWALVDFYSNLRLDSIPSNSDVAQVDPEIRIDLIDVSEVRLKLSLETSPNQRPHGALGMWGPILSAVGNAFKLQLHLRKVMHRSRFMRKSFILPAIVNRIKRDLIHNPLHILFSLDVLSMTKSTLASLSKGFAELSTDRQFLQLRSKQVWSRRITGFGDGFLQGTEAFAQGVAFGVTGVLTKPVENAREHGFLGFAHGLGRAFLGFVVQPLSGALDFVSLTVDGIGASFTKCLDILNNKATAQRIRNPRAIHSNGVIKEYCQKEAFGQMILYLAEASRHMGCTDIFKEPSKYAWSDFYEDHFIVPYNRIVLITNKRIMLLQSSSLDKLDKRPSKIMWDVPWEELLALELAKAGHSKPSHLIIHLKHFKRLESFVRVVRCDVDEEDGEDPQTVVICSCVRRIWKAHQSNVKVLTLKVPSSQRHIQFACDETDGRDSYKCHRPMIKPRGFPSASSLSDMRYKKHCVNFQKIWSSEQEYKSRCTLFPKQVIDDGTICSVWRPLCPNGYVSVGDVAHMGNHPPHVAAIYRDCRGNFSLPMGYDLVWRNCASDYSLPLSIWLPRPPDGFIAVGCVAVAAFEEPPLDSAYCISAELAVETEFEAQMVWSAPDSYPWACYIYQVQSEALQFIALRRLKEESDWKPMRVSDSEPSQVSETSMDSR